MNPINSMTGEPNQHTRTSVFQFDPYPPQHTINWIQSDPFANSVQQQINPGPSFQQPQILAQNPIQPFTILTSQPQTPIPNFMPHFSDSAFPQQLASFSFGTSKPVQDVVQFPFENHGFGHRTIQSMRCKRKTDSPPPQPAKQHITEEKMAEHMSKLHISSETVPLLKESESDKTQRLYMCEEMRKLQTDSILPQSLLAQMERPCTALVLWQPPTKLIPPIISSEKDENENNNEERPSDVNVMESEVEIENVNELVVNNMDMDNL
ncbi:hypothetical protein NQ317_018442 [Molorchus minor]|uniref:Uncharacterized protein n=1 Tax=Molorchus minor TaxID=1323400 RepID=A0ABQ9JEV9_9CUCU|nr:hypothetical protein NQ317_018442 [Molorchus minor]